MSDICYDVIHDACGICVLSGLFDWGGMCHECDVCLSVINVTIVPCASSVNVLCVLCVMSVIHMICARSAVCASPF